jgi:hypothetical protein
VSYATLAEAKTHLRITGLTWDEFITQLLPPLSELCDDTTGRTYGGLGAGFETHGLTVRFQLTSPRPGVILPEWPIQSMVGITLEGVALASNQYRVDSRTGYVQFLTSAGYPVDRSGKLDITVVAGYPVVPSGVALAVLRSLSYIKQRADEEGLGAELLGPQQTTWRATMDKFRNELHDMVFTHIARFELDVCSSMEQGEIW